MILLYDFKFLCFNYYHFNINVIKKIYEWMVQAIVSMFRGFVLLQNNVYCVHFPKVFIFQY